MCEVCKADPEVKRARGVRTAKTSGGVAGNAADRRVLLIATVTQIGPQLGIAPTCAALGLPRATYYRRRRPRHVPPRRRPSPRALTADEQGTVLARLHELRFVDLAPAEVYATLLDEGAYLCLERTMYRLLARRAEVQERRDQLRHPANCWPATPTSCGAGTSRSCWGRRSGPISISTSCSTSSVDTSSAGWWPIRRAPRSPSGSSTRRAPGRASGASS